ncbi:hypothetical protein [Paramicrobacterium chengjingii]|uniref:Uncharacterized protein n=1 Tax=Paramicrobacterium chengjingii TaxID=2769067 RepID=A0ABX6YJJ5_9MICO|nr:hypothetical protein [Microbacterium chengjingii]QPZ38522.1 hypothetical protein HCR76_17375 [Microbacterium chengjingii]
MMNASPELYYEIEYRQHERAVEHAAEQRRVAELSPEQVVPYVSMFSRLVTWLKGVVERRRDGRQARRAATMTGVDAAA